MLPCEITVVVIIWILTFINLIIGIQYMIVLHRDIVKWVYIYGEKIHSQKHFAIIGILLILSVLMFYNTFTSDYISETFLEHLLYNLACLFIVFPHIFEEQ